MACTDGLGTPPRATRPDLRIGQADPLPGSGRQELPGGAARPAGA